ncbi:MAG: TVP38/TMEM64 family protein, partial [Vibrionaceae bacterium]|nr:TVP38/TMEM64 family protein [Vibrionaceae bacterium]
LSSRYLLRDWVQTKFGAKLRAINEGVKKDGSSYLLSLRLIPVFPFFLINLLMGLTPMSVGRFYITSQIGMLPGTAVYLNAGTQLATIESLSDIVSPSVLASFALLGLFPIIVKWVMKKLRPNQVQPNGNS